MSTLYTMVAPCFFGTESTLNFEVKRLGAQNIQVTDGRVAFQGGADVIAAANLNLRTAERVLLLLATYKATTLSLIHISTRSRSATSSRSPSATGPSRSASSPTSSRRARTLRGRCLR